MIRRCATLALWIAAQALRVIVSCTRHSKAESLQATELAAL